MSRAFLSALGGIASQAPPAVGSAFTATPGMIPAANRARNPPRKPRADSDGDVAMAGSGLGGTAKSRKGKKVGKGPALPFGDRFFLVLGCQAD